MPNLFEAVSIRAGSHESRRPRRRPYEMPCSMFQSAPAPMRAGDPHPCALLPSRQMFQSAPAPMRAGDRLAQQTRRRAGCFNPRRLP